MVLRRVLGRGGGKGNGGMEKGDGDTPGLSPQRRPARHFRRGLVFAKKKNDCHCKNNMLLQNKSIVLTCKNNYFGEKYGEPLKKQKTKSLQRKLG